MRVLLAPRWLVAHVLVVVIVAGCVSAGLWQLRRLAERQALNALVEERMSAPPVPLEQLLTSDLLTPEVLADAAGADELAALEYRRVLVTGRYLPGEQLLLSPRTRAGAPGHDVLSPLRTPEGTVVVVDRGFIPFEPGVPPPVPDGEVQLEGRVRRSQERIGIGPRIPPVAEAPRLERVPHVDLPRLAVQLPEPLAPVFVELAGPPPAVAGAPQPVEPPQLDEGNHRSYAVQWFLFALTGTVGYPLLLRKTVQEARAGTSTGTAPPTPRTREPVR